MEWRRDVAGRWTSNRHPESFCQAGCIDLHMPMVCRRAILERCSEWPARHGRHNSTGIYRRPFADFCSTIRRSAPTSLTASALAPASSQPCACGSGPDLEMKGHRLRSPVGCNFVPPACGKTSCPTSGAAGLLQPACPAFAMTAGCATAARLVVRALPHFVRLASCHNSTAPSATPLSRNRLARQARAPGVSSA